MGVGICNIIAEFLQSIDRPLLSPRRTTSFRPSVPRAHNNVVDCVFEQYVFVAGTPRIYFLPSDVFPWQLGRFSYLNHSSPLYLIINTTRPPPALTHIS